MGERMVLGFLSKTGLAGNVSGTRRHLPVGCFGDLPESIGIFPMESPNRISTVSEGMNMSYAAFEMYRYDKPTRAIGNISARAGRGRKAI